MLCANKTDLPEDQWTVKREEYESFARENGYNLMEASASTGTNVQELFIELGRQVLQTNRHELAEVDDRDRQSRDGESLILFDFNERERRRKQNEANRKCCVIS